MRATARSLRLALPLAAFAALSAGLTPAAVAQTAAPPPGYDETLARTLGADDHGMRRYVLVILKTGPRPMAPGPARDEMFRGHFANMKRLSAEGKLALAGPLDGVEGRRGIFVMAVADVAEARALTETDPVIVNGEMVAEYHRYYGSAALMLVRDAHERVAKKSF
ncbi:MAG: hypothetical protein KF683_21680 [Rubrivivax sp.]|nr:hypothetical protein [Rubrivivax sp.]